MRGQDEVIVNVNEWARRECGKPAKANRKAHWLCFEVGNKDHRRRMLTQTRDHIAPRLCRKWLSVAHGIVRIGIEKVQDGALMIRIRQVRLDDTYRKLIHEMDISPSTVGSSGPCRNGKLHRSIHVAFRISVTTTGPCASLLFSYC